MMDAELERQVWQAVFDKECMVRTLVLSSVHCTVRTLKREAQSRHATPLDRTVRIVRWLCLLQNRLG